MNEQDSSDQLYELYTKGRRIILNEAQVQRREMIQTPLSSHPIDQSVRPETKAQKTTSVRDYPRDNRDALWYGVIFGGIGILSAAVLIFTPNNPNNTPNTNQSLAQSAEASDWENWISLNLANLHPPDEVIKTANP